jgi:hypothetical protein
MLNHQTANEKKFSNSLIQVSRWGHRPAIMVCPAVYRARQEVDLPATTQADVSERLDKAENCSTDKQAAGPQAPAVCPDRIKCT